MPGKSRNAVIEHALEMARQRDDGDQKGDLILAEIGRLADAQERVAAGVDRLRKLLSYQVWMGFEEVDDQPETYEEFQKGFNGWAARVTFWKPSMAYQSGVKDQNPADRC
jgi:hypothetical protein